MNHCKQCGNAVPDPDVIYALQEEIERLTKEREEAWAEFRALSVRAGANLSTCEKQLAAVTRERDELRYGNVIKYGTSHPEMYKTELDYCKEQLAAVTRERDEIADVMDYRCGRYAEELAACQRDAARYRWLRDTMNPHFKVLISPERCEPTLDAAIDAAMKEQRT